MTEVEENDEFSLDFNFPMKLESEVLNIKVGVHRHILKDLFFLILFSLWWLKFSIKSYKNI